MHSTIDIRADRRGSPLNHPWKRCTTLGRAFDATRADVLEHLAYLQREIGFSYVRFHALFHDDMRVALRNSGGRLFSQWHQVDKVYDSLLAIGLRPFVELNPMPAALASGE